MDDACAKSVPRPAQYGGGSGFRAAEATKKVESPGSEEKKKVLATEATPVSLQTLSTYRINSLDLSNGSIKAVTGTQVEKVNPENLSDKINQHAIFVQNIGTKAEKTELPEALRTSLPAAVQATAVKLSYKLTASQGSTSNPIHLSAYVAPTAGLVFDAARAVYKGGFSVALSNVDDPADRRSLELPINVLVTAQGASEVLPTPLAIADLGQWHPVSITVSDPPSPYRVQVSADPQDKGNGIDLAVARPTIQLIPASTHVVGWGIGQIAIAIRAAGLGGLSISLQTDHGGLSPSSVILDGLGNATVSLRSDSASSAIVRVGNMGTNSDSVTIGFDPPWLFLACAMLGGLFGAFVRERGRKFKARAFAIGVVSAVLMTLAYAVGIDWVSRVIGSSQLASSGEAVIFVLGAIAALVGASALIPKPRG